jgi:hypothetical protein
MDAMLADRPQQHLNESAVPSAANHKEISSLCRVNQHTDRVSLPRRAG